MRWLPGLLRTALAIGLASHPQAVLAQEAQGSDSVPPFPPASTLQEMERWLKRELPRMGSYSMVYRGANGYTGSMRAEIADVSFSACILKFTAIALREGGVRLVDGNTVILKDLDISRLRSAEVAVPTGYTQSRPHYSVLMYARSGRDSAFTVQSTGYAEGPTTRSQDASYILVSDSLRAAQLAAALRRASVLCGAPNVPLQSIAATAPLRSDSPATPPTTAAPALRNSDVLEMAAAGLSDSVITTAIRQATIRDFDLSPTGLINLKRGSVSDAVISVMQGTNAPPTVAPPPPPAPRYDPTLTNRPPPPANDACAGIEDMGLGKRDLMPAAVGGVVEWLAVIRNNTAVTKIVVVGWRDMYGQEKRAQVQIRGGEIARVRLDLTQPRVIPPVSNARVLSCQ